MVGKGIRKDEDFIHSTSIKDDNSNKRLWFLWGGLIISYFGIFVVSISLTHSLPLFLNLADKGEYSIICQLIGIVTMTVGIVLVLTIILKRPGKSE